MQKRKLANSTDMTPEEIAKLRHHKRTLGLQAPHHVWVDYSKGLVRLFAFLFVCNTTELRTWNTT